MHWRDAYTIYGSLYLCNPQKKYMFYSFYALMQDYLILYLERGICITKVWQMKEPTVEAVFGVDAGIVWEALNKNGPSVIGDTVKATGSIRANKASYKSSAKEDYKSKKDHKNSKDRSSTQTKRKD
jgi:hypothetical protein